MIAHKAHTALCVLPMRGIGPMLKLYRDIKGGMR